MSKYGKLIVGIMLFVGLITNAYSQRSRLGFFINAAGYFPTQKNIHSGYGSGIGGVFFIKPNISLSLEWKYGRFRVDKEEGKFLDGRLTVTPILASIHYNLLAGETFSPYVFAGGGLFFSSIRLGERANLEEAKVRKQEIKNGLGLYGGIGSTIKLNQRLSLFIEGLYLAHRADAETIYLENSPSSTFRANLSSLNVLIGLDYFY